MPVLAAALPNGKGPWLPTRQHPTQANGNRCNIPLHGFSRLEPWLGPPGLYHSTGQRAAVPSSHNPRHGYLGICILLTCAMPFRSIGEGGGWSTASFIRPAPVLVLSIIPSEG